MAKPTFWLLVLAAISFGFLLGWEAFGAPSRISDFYKSGNIAEWVTAIGTILVGIGAWKYARAAHFHTLDRADAEGIRLLREKFETLSLISYKFRKAKGGRSSVRAIEENPPPYINGVIYAAIEAAKNDADIITWEDGACVAFSVDSRALFAQLFILKVAFVRRCNFTLKVFDVDSDAQLTPSQGRLYGLFREASIQMADKVDEIIAAIDSEQDSIARDSRALLDKRSARKRVFDFDP